MAETLVLKVVAAHHEMVNGHDHITRIKLEDGTMQDVAEVIRAMEAHEAHYVMIPPEGAPAYRAHQETGLLLELQTRQCPDCDQVLLFA